MSTRMCRYTESSKSVKVVGLTKVIKRTSTCKQFGDVDFGAQGLAVYNGAVHATVYDEAKKVSKAALPVCLKLCALIETNVCLGIDHHNRCFEC